MSIGNKYGYQTKYLKPQLPKKTNAPQYVRLSNSSAEVVLQEKKVEIKDLESKVIYLQKQIKELKTENRTLKDVQHRQEKDIRKSRDGIADIPSLLRSHREETKALQSNILSLRKELRDCQKDLKSKCDAIIKKDNLIDKNSMTLKRSEKHLQETSLENKELRSEKKKLEEECKKLSATNEELKSKSERLQKKVQQMTNKILELEESLGSANHHKTQLKEDLSKLQKQYDELQKNFILPKSNLYVETAETQTDIILEETFPNFSATCDSKSCFKPIENSETLNAFGDHMNKKDCEQSEEKNNETTYPTKDCNINYSDLQIPRRKLQQNPYVLEKRTNKSLLLKPLKTKNPISAKVQNIETEFDFSNVSDVKSYFYESPYQSSTFGENYSSLKNIGIPRNLCNKNL